jgi:hypothetical protein
LKKQTQGSSLVATLNKTKLIVTIVFTSSICRDAWFVDSRASQHLTFQEEVFWTFEKSILNHKVYLRDNSMLDVHGKGIIVFNLPNGISKCIGNVLYVPKLAKRSSSMKKLT